MTCSDLFYEIEIGFYRQALQRARRNYYKLPQVARLSNTLQKAAIDRWVKRLDDVLYARQHSRDQKAAYNRAIVQPPTPIVIEAK